MSTTAKKTIVLFEISAALTLFAVLAVIALKSFLPAAAMAHMSFDPPTPGSVDAALSKVGLTPERLAAAGVSTVETTAIVDAMWDELTTDNGLIDGPEATLASAKREADYLTRLVRSGQATQQQITDAATARQDEATARAARDGVLDTLFTDLSAALSTEEKSTLSTMRANSTWDLDLEFKVITRTQPDWIELRDALAHERIAAKDGEAVDQNVQTYLQQQRANASVSTAKTNLDNNLASIQQAWNDALSGE